MFDFFGHASNPSQTAANAPGIAGDAGTAIIGLGRNMGDSGTVGAGSALGAVGNTVTGISELTHGQYGAGIGDLASGALKGVNALGQFGVIDKIPGLGIAAGAASAVGHEVEAWRHADQIDAGYQNNQFWTEQGKATWGAASAIAAADPTGIAQLYVGGTKLALDGVGWLSGEVGQGINALFGTDLDLSFNAASAVGALEHAAFDTGQVIGGGLMHVGEGALDVAGGVGRGALDVASGIGSGAWDAVKGVGSGVADVAGGIGSGIVDAGSGILHGIGDVASGIGSGFNNFAEGNILEGIGDIAGGIGSGVVDTVGGLAHGAWDVVSGVGSGIADVASGIGHGIADVAGGIGHGIADVASGVSSAVSSVLSW